MKYLKNVIPSTLVLFFGVVTVSADVSAVDITNALNKNLNHPYLYFTDEEKPSLIERTKNDRECKDLLQRMTAECNRLLYTPVEKLPPPKELNPDYEESDELLSYLRSNIHHAHLLAFLYQMTGEERYASKSFEFADVVCDLPTWVGRRHEFPIIYDRVWPWNVPDDQPAFGYDIETADTAWRLAAVYDWLYPALNKRQRDRIRGALLEKAITRVRNNYDYHWWAKSYRCNWCAVCFAGLGTASLALLTEDPNLTDVIAESYNRIGKLLDEIGEDGGWQEGCGYYRKSIHAMNFFADPLKRLTCGQYDLYDHKKLRDNPIAFLLYNMVIPKRLLVFEDSGAYRAGTSHIWNKLSEEVQSGETAWFRNYMWREGRDVFDIIWPRSSAVPVLPKQPSRHFRTIDWVIMRSDFTDPDNAVVACKAGYNDDPHHGHLDCGQVTVYWREQEFICDTKPAAYDHLYFLEERFQYPQAISTGHNVVFVNGEQQLSAKHKDQPLQKGIGGKVLEFRPGRTHDYVLMDPSGAYPGKEMKGWRRHIIHDKPHVTVVVDEVRSAPGAEIEARFHSDCRIDVRDSHVLLRGEKGMMALIPAVDGAFSIRRGKHPVLPIKKSARYSTIPFFGTVVEAQKERSVIATVILPVEDVKEAEQLAKSVKMKTDGSGNLALSVSGQKWKFKMGNDGLVLE